MSETLNRCHLHVAPPQRRVVCRKSPLVAPLLQTILLVPKGFDIQAKDFDRPYDKVEYDVPPRKRARAEESSGQRKSDRPFGVVKLMAWPDSTLRELLESCLLQFPNECQEWLRSGEADNNNSSNAAVKVSQVYPGQDRHPGSTHVATLRLNGPVEALSDLVTINELSSSSRFQFRAGDLLTFTLFEQPVPVK